MERLLMTMILTMVRVLMILMMMVFSSSSRGRRGAFGSYRWPSATCDPPTSQTVIGSDPVQISQIRHGKSPLSQPALIVFDPVQISQICYGKSPSASQP